MREIYRIGQAFYTFHLFACEESHVLVSRSCRKSQFWPSDFCDLDVESSQSSQWVSYESKSTENGQHLHCSNDSTCPTWFINFVTLKRSVSLWR